MLAPEKEVEMFGHSKLRALKIAALGAVVAASLAGSASADDLSPAALLARYQPVIVLDTAEAFAPSSVEGFLTHSDLQLRGVDGTYATVDVPPPGLPVHGDGWRLDHRNCSPTAGISDVGCYAAAADGASVVYGRYAVRAGAIVLQYWYFYDFNFWSLQYPPSDLVWQAHEGDWEVVTIVLDDMRHPVEAAYSQHCTGQRKPWSSVQKLAGTDHPIVFVATGSHANLFEPGVRAFPLSCLPAEAVELFQAIGVTPLDFSFPGATLGPSATAIERIHENAPRWLRFPGTWGETQYVHAPAPIGTVPFGAGPDGPQAHDVWIDPLGTIAGYPAE